jgi:hypothetical protein
VHGPAAAAFDGLAAGELDDGDAAVGEPLWWPEQPAMRTAQTATDPANPNRRLTN